jgi:hypothetical protein
LKKLSGREKLVQKQKQIKYKIKKNEKLLKELGVNESEKVVEEVIIDDCDRRELTSEASTVDDVNEESKEDSVEDIIVEDSKEDSDEEPILVECEHSELTNEVSTNEQIKLGESLPKLTRRKYNPRIIR